MRKSKLLKIVDPIADAVQEEFSQKKIKDILDEENNKNRLNRPKNTANILKNRLIDFLSNYLQIERKSAVKAHYISLREFLNTPGCKELYGICKALSRIPPAI